MIGTWMLYSTAWGLWLSAVAVVLERLLLRGRGPVRAVWSVALVASVGGPALGYAFARPREPRAPVASSTSVVATQSSATPTSVGRIDPASMTVPTPASAPRRRIGEALGDVARRADRPLAIVWAGLSLGMLVYLAGGLIHLQYLRRRWRAGTVNGTTVMISEDTGPALVGVLGSTIVIPAWVLELDPEDVSLMLRHEIEHQLAGDARMLALAHVVLAVMPWNPMLWWQLRRLRLAVELDCDARVLRVAPNVHSYGTLLLEFARARRQLRFAGAALADDGAQLEQRIRLMTRRATVGRARAGVVSVLGGALAVAAACQLPTPSRPATPAGTPATDRGANVVVQSTPSRNSPGQADTLMAVKQRRSGSVAFDDTRATGVARAVSSQASGDWGAQQQPREPHITVSIDNAPIGNVLRMFAEFAHRTILPSRRVVGTITATIVDQPWNTALRDVMNANGYDVMVNPDRSIIVDTFEAIAARQEPIVFYSDSAAAAQLQPGCSASPTTNDSAVVKLLLTDLAAAPGGRVEVTSAQSDVAGAQVNFTYPGSSETGLMCSLSRTGQLRLFGRGAFNGSPIVIRTSVPTTLVVMTGSGRVLAGPVVVQNAVRTYDLAWSAVPR